MTSIKRQTLKKAVALILTALMVLSVFSTLIIGADAAATSFTKVNFLQADSRWGNLTYNGSNLTTSGCGILSIVNAVYNCTGNFIQPKDVADWAYANKYFNQNASGGGGIFDRQVFFAAGDKFGAQYNFQVVGGGWGNSYATDLKTHCMNMGTAVVHVYGHFMSIVDYNPDTNKFLVFDCAPGSGGPVNSTNRRYLTAAAGDWKTPAELNTGMINIDAYWLYQPLGSDYQPDPNKYNYPDRVLKYTSGSATMTGSDVMWVQAVLYRLGYTITIDGSYGPGTASVVTQFQGDHGLDQDGSCGPLTRAKLKEEWEKIDPSVAKTYSFNYDANGGTLGESGAFTVTFGNDFTVMNDTATRAGYEFKGWNARRNGDNRFYSTGGWCTESEIAAGGYTKAVYQNNRSFTFNNSWTDGYDGVSTYTFFAIWEKAATYTVTYNANGGSGAPAAQTKSHGVSLVLSSAVPTRSGYTFCGWADNPNAKEAQYIAGGSYNADANITLYAVWEAIPTYTVTYDANGGSGAPAAQTKTKGVTLVLSGTAPTRSGFRFIGWSSDKNAVTAQYLPGSRYNKDASIALYAVWEKSAEAVKGDANGDGSVDSMDATLIVLYDAGLRELTAQQIAACDLNGDGEVDTLDATLIFKYDAGLIDSI